MSDESQISATVSASTREKLDRFTESRGLKKNFVIEQALLYFMEARRDLPDDLENLLGWMVDVDRESCAIALLSPLGVRDGSERS